MKARRGFTLIELMVVILIVAILAAVAIPIMRGRIDAAKWSEGKAMMGTIASALRAYAAEKNEAGPVAALAGVNGTADGFLPLGILTSDLRGTYFDGSLFTINSASYNVGSNTLQFEIQADAPGEIDSPSVVTLSHIGEWLETP